MNLFRWGRGFFRGVIGLDKLEELDGLGDLDILDILGELDS